MILYEKMPGRRAVMLCHNALTLQKQHLVQQRRTSKSLLSICLLLPLLSVMSSQWLRLKLAGQLLGVVAAWCSSSTLVCS